MMHDELSGPIVIFIINRIYNYFFGFPEIKFVWRLIFLQLLFNYEPSSLF